MVPESGADKYTLQRCQSSEDSGSCLIVPTACTCSPPPALFLPLTPPVSARSVRTDHSTMSLASSFPGFLFTRPQTTAIARSHPPDASTRGSASPARLPKCHQPLPPMAWSWGVRLRRLHLSLVLCSVGGSESSKEHLPVPLPRAQTSPLMGHRSLLPLLWGLWLPTSFLG